MAKNRPNWPIPGKTQGVCFRVPARKYPILQSVMGFLADSEGFHTGTSWFRADRKFMVMPREMDVAAVASVTAHGNRREELRSSSRHTSWCPWTIKFHVLLKIIRSLGQEWPSIRGKGLRIESVLPCRHGRWEKSW